MKRKKNDHTVGTVLKFNTKIEGGIIDTPNTQIHDHLEPGISLNSGGIKLL